MRLPFNRKMLRKHRLFLITLGGSLSILLSGLFLAGILMVLVACLLGGPGRFFKFLKDGPLPAPELFAAFIGASVGIVFGWLWWSGFCKRRGWITEEELDRIWKGVPSSQRRSHQ